MLFNDFICLSLLRKIVNCKSQEVVGQCVVKKAFQGTYFIQESSALRFSVYRKLKNMSLNSS